MKTKLLFILLFVTSVSFAQNWQQVGTTQFTTTFSDKGEIAFDNVGVPYVLYRNPTSSGVYVMKFNGTVWESVGSSISVEDYNNLAISINPVTNQPWVALKASLSGANSNVDVYSYNGTAWTVEGSNVGGNFLSHGIQLKFSATGVPRFAALITGTTNTAKFYTQDLATGVWNVNSHEASGVDARIDFMDFDHYLLSDSQGFLKKYEISTGNSSIFMGGSTNPNEEKFKPVSGISGTNYWAAINSDANVVYVKNGTTNMSPSVFGSTVTNGILSFAESSNNYKQYLMYSDYNENLAFQKYNYSGNWSGVPDIGVSTNSANFFAKMEMNPVDGNMYVLYKDGDKISVKMYNTMPLLDLPRMYVDIYATGTGDGSSWANAYTNLQTALEDVYLNTTEIWIAAGTYKREPYGGNVFKSFILDKDNFKIYGGFNGTETSITERNIMANPTILSGDLKNNDTAVDFRLNSRNDNTMVILSIYADGVLLDGIQVTDGTSGGPAVNGYSYGSAILIDTDVTSLTLKNCQIRNNVSPNGGAVRGYFNNDAEITIENCIFDNNLGRYGSALYLINTATNPATTELDVSITNSLFTNNKAKDYADYNANYEGYSGSAVWIRVGNNAGSTVNTTITNCTFANNEDLGTSVGEKGPLAFGREHASSTQNAIISNSIFYGNTKTGGVTSQSINNGHLANGTNITVVSNSIGEDSFPNQTYLINTSNANPLFTDATNNDFTLSSGSPAIDTGDNALIPTGVTTDLLGYQRIYNTTVDMGPYEFSSTLSTNNFNVVENAVRLYPNPTNSFLTINMKAPLKVATVFNVQGQKIFETNSNQLDVSRLTNGIYLITVENENGSITTKKFVKQ